MSTLEALPRTSTPDYSEEEIAERNSRARADSAAIRDRRDTAVAEPVWAYNHFLMYGQSLAAGQGAWPTKSTNAVDGVFMLGDCERPGSGDAAYYPVGYGIDAAPLRPLVGVVLKPADRSAVSAGDQSNLGLEPSSLGESPLVGALHFARHLTVQSKGLAADPDHKWVGSNAAMGAKTVAQLSKGATPDVFGRLAGAVNQVRAIADREGASFGIAGFFYLQGEDDSIRETDKLAYKTRVKQIHADVVTDLAAGIARQSKPPVMITYQTGAQWAREGVAIGQAQFELSLENPGWYLAAPAYAVTNRKDHHLDANGSRWLGMQLGKVWHEVVIRGRGWRPTSPLRARYCNRTVLVEFHVPAPPLRFAPVWVGTKAVTYRSKGFSVRDKGGGVPLGPVKIVGDAIVSLECVRALVGPVTVYYGQPSVSQGNGNLCDSDDTVACANYEYDPNRGDLPQSNIEELVGKPYPLWNWSVAFAIEATGDRAASSEDSAVQQLLAAHSRVLNPVDPAPEAYGERRGILSRAGWKAKILAAVFILMVIDGIVTARGRLIAEEAVPQRFEGSALVWQKRCDYRTSFVHQSLFVGAVVGSPELAQETSCPLHLR